MDEKEEATGGKPYITLKDNFGKMRIRKKVNVSRTNSYNLEKDAKSYFHSQLMSFYS